MRLWNHWQTHLQFSETIMDLICGPFFENLKKHDWHEKKRTEAKLISWLHKNERNFYLDLTNQISVQHLRSVLSDFRVPFSQLFSHVNLGTHRHRYYFLRNVLIDFWYTFARAVCALKWCNGRTLNFTKFLNWFCS